MFPATAAELLERQALIRRAAAEYVPIAIRHYGAGALTEEEASRYVALQIELAILNWELILRKAKERDGA